MRTKMILTAVGRDQPGIVAGVTKVLFETGCNIEDSSMTQLGGEFAMMLLVTLGKEVTAEEIQSALRPLEEESGLLFSLRPLSREAQAGSRDRKADFVISVYGADHPGIVYGVANLLAQRGVNIADLSTHVIGEKDATVYCMLLEVELGQGADSKALEKDLRAKAQSLSVDITIRPVEPVEL